MEFTETRRLYQQLAAELKRRIEAGVYPVGDKLPAERYISEEMNVSRTVVRESDYYAGSGRLCRSTQRLRHPCDV